MVPLPSPARRFTGMRLISICLAGLWAAVGVAVVFAYQPGGPFDLMVRATIFAPLCIAVLGIIWPPSAGSWRARAAIVWLALLSGLLLMPLLAIVLDTLRGPASEALVPSGEVVYTGLLALGMTCLYAAIGVVRAHETRLVPTRASFIQALSLAIALTVLASVILGIPSVANELALRDRPHVSSRFGPTDPTLALPHCEEVPLVGGNATLTGSGTATIDNKDMEDVQLRGNHQGALLENWVASRSGQFGSGSARYHRVGSVADIVDTLGTRSIAATDLGPDDPRGLSVDAPIATLIASGLTRVAEDRGIELVEEARARHCRSTLDGPSALAASVLVRLLVDGSVQPVSTLEPWRGTLDWWVFADGELGQAVITIGGYPGDAWATGGIQASIVARMTATNRSGSAIIPVVSGTPNP